MPGRTAIYLRISDDKAGQFVGVGNQRAACRELCERNGWVDVETYMDNDISATKGTYRQSYARLMQDVQAGLIDRIVVFHLSRLWRNRRERAEGIEILRHQNGSVVCAKGPTIDLSTAYGRGMAAMIGEVDTMEVELKSERQKLANDARLKAGQPNAGGPRAFGYQSGGLVIDEAERPYAKRSFEMWVDGATMGDICRWLDREGVRTTRGNKWTTGSLRRMLGNPRYAGIRGIRPLLFNEDGKPILNERGEQRRSDFYEPVCKGTWPAIVEEELWQAAQERLRHPSRKTGRPSEGRKWLLAGIARCATCDRVMKTKTNNQQRSLSCPTFGHATRKAEPVETYVRDIILARLRKPDALDLLRRRAPRVDFKALNDEAEAIQERLRVLARDEVLGRRSRDEVLAAREVANERLDEIKGIFAEAGRVDIVARFLTDGVDPAVVWNSSDTTLSMKQGLIEALAVVRIGSGRNGRPAKYSDDVPPPNVFVDWRVSGA